QEDGGKVLGIKTEGVDVTAGRVDGTAFESIGGQLMTRDADAKRESTTLLDSVSASHNSWTGVQWHGKQLFQAPTYQISQIVDRVGGGDSFMGGLIYGLITWPSDDQQALNFAVAASCLKHTIKGDFNLVTVDEVEKLMRGDASGRVSR